MNNLISYHLITKLFGLCHPYIVHPAHVEWLSAAHINIIDGRQVQLDQTSLNIYR